MGIQDIVAFYLFIGWQAQDCVAAVQTTRAGMQGDDLLVRRFICLCLLRAIRFGSIWVIMGVCLFFSFPRSVNISGINDSPAIRYC